VRELLPPGEQLTPGRWRMTFETQVYFDLHGLEGFYPVVQVEFVVRASDQHYHVPLLLSPYGFSTYRGS
jgi:5-hydroxyisourate hydrolase